MEEYIYCVRCETYACGCTVRQSCGIAAVTVTDGVLSVADSVSDISADEESVRKLAALCTELKLSPLHLRDVVDDYLGRK